MTGTAITTKAGLELTRHVATETLAAKYALDTGRRAARMNEIDALVISAGKTEQAGRETELLLKNGPRVKVIDRPTLKFQRSDLPQAYVVTSIGSQPLPA